DETRRAQRPGREVAARRRAMRELDALARAGEDDRVLADDVAAAQRREADRARRPLAGDAFARVDRVIGEAHAGARGGRLAELERRARRRVDLVAVMHLDDLDVERRAE